MTLTEPNEFTLIEERLAADSDAFKKSYLEAGHDESIFVHPYTCSRCGAQQIDLSEDLCFGGVTKCISRESTPTECPVSKPPRINLGFRDFEGPIFIEPGKLDPLYSIPMILFCPNGHRHLDEHAFAEKPHNTHACQECGIVWTPAKVNTHGVQFLPGYKNPES